MRPEDWSFLVSKLDKMDSRMDTMNETLIRNTASLEHHIARTDALEGELKPIKKVTNVLIAIWAVLGAGLAVAVALHELGLF